MDSSHISAASAKAFRKSVRLATNRVSSETLLHYAVYLPEVPRAIITAHLDLGMNAKELAILHRVSPRQMRRRLDRLRETLADPCFLLAAKYADQLPANLAPLAKGYWIEGLTLRELSRRQGQTLHRIRNQIPIARSLLVILLSGEHKVSSAQACAALQHSCEVQ